MPLRRRAAGVSGSPARQPDPLPTPGRPPLLSLEEGGVRGGKRQLEENGDSFNEDKLSEEYKAKTEALSVKMLQFGFF